MANLGSIRVPDRLAQSTARSMMQNVTIDVVLNPQAITRGLWGRFRWRRWLGLRLATMASLVLGCKLKVGYDEHDSERPDDPPGTQKGEESS